MDLAPSRSACRFCSANTKPSSTPSSSVWTQLVSLLAVLLGKYGSGRDPAATGRLEAAAHEITVAPDHPDVLTVHDLRIYLARQIDLKGSVDAGQCIAA